MEVPAVSESKSETNWLRKSHKTILGFKTSGAVRLHCGMEEGKRQSNYSKGCHTVVQKALIGEKDASSNVVSTFVKTMPIESAGFLLFSTSVMPHTLSASQYPSSITPCSGFCFGLQHHITGTDSSRPFLVAPMPFGMLLQRLSE